MKQEELQKYYDKFVKLDKFINDNDFKFNSINIYKEFPFTFFLTDKFLDNYDYVKNSLNFKTSRYIDNSEKELKKLSVIESILKNNFKDAMRQVYDSAHQFYTICYTDNSLRYDLIIPHDEFLNYMKLLNFYNKNLQKLIESEESDNSDVSNIFDASDINHYAYVNIKNYLFNLIDDDFNSLISTNIFEIVMDYFINNYNIIKGYTTVFDIYDKIRTSVTEKSEFYKYITSNSALTDKVDKFFRLYYNEELQYYLDHSIQYAIDNKKVTNNILKSGLIYKISKESFLTLASVITEKYKNKQKALAEKINLLFEYRYFKRNCSRDDDELLQFLNTYVQYVDVPKMNELFKKITNSRVLNRDIYPKMNIIYFISNIIRYDVNKFNELFKAYIQNFEYQYEYEGLLNKIVLIASNKDLQDNVYLCNVLLSRSYNPLLTPTQYNETQKIITFCYRNFYYGILNLIDNDISKTSSIIENATVYCDEKCNILKLSDIVIASQNCTNVKYVFDNEETKIKLFDVSFQNIDALYNDTDNENKYLLFDKILRPYCIDYMYAKFLADNNYFKTIQISDSYIEKALYFLGKYPMIQNKYDSDFIKQLNDSISSVTLKHLLNN